MVFYTFEKRESGNFLFPGRRSPAVLQDEWCR